ncbi:hypothetical protein AB1K91_02590 [Terribacillus sp. 179-K 1B1 HS]|uniref:hypothetical protein n=1 Tax=Terribacillus sp. 179-K 1B1 HS TaxID=3142388 RepID=UPI0039A0F9B6
MVADDRKEMQERIKQFHEEVTKRRLAAGLPADAPDLNIVPATVGEYAYVKLGGLVPVVAKYITTLHKFNRPIPMDTEIFEEYDLPLVLLSHCSEDNGLAIGLEVAIGIVEKCNDLIESGEEYDIDDLKSRSFYAGQFIKIGGRHQFTPWGGSVTREDQDEHKREVQRLLNDDEYLNKKLREVGDRYRTIEPLLEERYKNAKLKRL